MSKKMFDFSGSSLFHIPFHESRGTDSCHTIWRISSTGHGNQYTLRNI